MLRTASTSSIIIVRTSKSLARCSIGTSPAGCVDPVDDEVHCLLRRRVRRIDNGLGIIGWFVWIGDASELSEQSRPRLRVQTFPIPRLAYSNRSADIYEKKTAD